ncbi:MAG: hypothetical protein Tsb0033_21170 [Winogradskyella sp.]
MSNISILIVDDDINKISTIISTIKSEVSDVLSINQASNVQEAIEYLQRKEFHLLITDLKMPLRRGDLPDNSGGLSLVKSLYRKRTNANVPMYIIGLTQFPELKKDLKNVWKVWRFEASDEIWKLGIRDLIFHISLVKSRINVEKLETVFVEGITDKIIIDKGFDTFFPEKVSSIYVDAIKSGGGASWVERQLFIWAKSLSRKTDESGYIQAIGLFDDDKSGNTIIENLRNTINVNSAEGSTFFIKKSCYKYSPILKSIKNKGITFPTTIEDVLSEHLWKIALDNDYLIPRNLDKIIIDDSKINLKNSSAINQKKLMNLGFTDTESIIILYKINDDSKKAFSSMVRKASKESLMPLKFLIEDFLKTLKIDFDSLKE